MKKILSNYGVLIGALCLTIVLSRMSPVLFDLFYHSADAGMLITFFAVSVLFLLSFVIHYCAVRVHFPSFVVAIFFGIAAQPMLGSITAHDHILGIIVGAGATLILFGGGLETPFDNFKKLIWKILSLSFFGLFLTAVLLSCSVYFLGNLFGTHVPVVVAALLGAILASTDPAAIIPVLRSLRFNNRQTKDLVISESAVTDVTGTLLTVAFLGILVAGGSFISITDAYQSLFSAEVGHILFEEILYGVIFGVLGFGLLTVLTRAISNHGQEAEAHAAYFLFVPLCIFTLAAAFHGSGYLASFIAGLLFVLSRHMHQTEHFFNYTIEGFFKPTIFILLGALVDIPELIAYAGIGIVASVLFMFVIRPISVFLTLAPFSLFGKDRFTVKELIFVSFVRETGAIPAVLLITVMSSGIPGLDGLVPIGMWVILSTLIVEPPLTPFIAKWLGVAQPIKDSIELAIQNGKTPFVVLGSRGYSFLDRLPYVTQWAVRHNIYRIVVLHCPEDKYTQEYAASIEGQAKLAFMQVNNTRSDKGEATIDFEYISRTGFLQDNIDALAKEDDLVTAIFVGRKVLDYRLDQVKNLKVPLFFID